MVAAAQLMLGGEAGADRAGMIPVEHALIGSAVRKVTTRTLAVAAIAARRLGDSCRPDKAGIRAAAGSPMHAVVEPRAAGARRQRPPGCRLRGRSTGRAAAAAPAGYCAWVGVRADGRGLGLACWARFGSTRIWSSSALVSAGSASLASSSLSSWQLSPRRSQAASASVAARAVGAEQEAVRSA